MVDRAVGQGERKLFVPPSQLLCRLILCLAILRVYLTVTHPQSVHVYVKNPMFVIRVGLTLTVTVSSMVTQNTAYPEDCPSGAKQWGNYYSIKKN